MKKRYKIFTIILVSIIFLTGFSIINIDLTRTLGESYYSPIKIHYEEKPLSIKIELQNYEVELSKNSFEKLLRRLN